MCKLTINYKAPYEIGFIEKGEWVDLKTAEDCSPFNILALPAEDFGSAPRYEMISLGIAMDIPEGFEAHLVPRSSTFIKHKLLLANSIGIIDHSYRGNNDIWKFCAVSFGNALIKKGTKIAQFRIQLSQKATIWQKIKWLFTTKIVFNKVDTLDYVDRGGFGTTGE